MNRFDLEQQILECWKVTDDIRTALEYGNSDLPASMEAVAKVNDLRFEKLWAIFEEMCATQKFADTSILPKSP